MSRELLAWFVFLVFANQACTFAEETFDQNHPHEIREASPDQATFDRVDEIVVRFAELEARLDRALVTIEQMSRNDDTQNQAIATLEQKIDNCGPSLGSPNEGSRPNMTDNIDEWVTSLSRDKIRRVRPVPVPRPNADLKRRRRFSELLRQKRALTETEELLIKEKYTELTLLSHKCAFSAIRTQPLLGHSDPQVVTFHATQTNLDGAFDENLGVFVTAIPGTYFFSFTMRSYDNKYIGVSLMLNDDPVVAMTTDASDRKVMQTQSAILHLNLEDQVWLLLGPSEYFALYGNSNNYVTFNGHLLYPDYIES